MSRELHTLYRFYAADDTLLYVGITCDPGSRLKQHRTSKEWWSEVASVELEQYATRARLERAERNAITAERPRYNIAGNDPCERCAAADREAEAWRRRIDEEWAEMARLRLPVVELDAEGYDVSRAASPLLEDRSAA